MTNAWSTVTFGCWSKPASERAFSVASQYCFIKLGLSPRPRFFDSSFVILHSDVKYIDSSSTRMGVTLYLSCASLCNRAMSARTVGQWRILYKQSTLCRYRYKSTFRFSSDIVGLEAGVHPYIQDGADPNKSVCPLEDAPASLGAVGSGYICSSSEFSNTSRRPATWQFDQYKISPQKGAFRSNESTSSVRVAQNSGATNSPVPPTR
jgi:hypothetical protein